MRRAFALLVCIVACGSEPGPELSASVRVDPLLVMDTQSVRIYVFGPKLSNGVSVPCSVLRKQLIDPDDKRLEKLGNIDVVIGSGSEVSITGVTEGEGRVVYVEAANASDAVIGNGCVDKVKVDDGKTTNVEVTVYPL